MPERNSPLGKRALPLAVLFAALGIAAWMGSKSTAAGGVAAAACLAVCLLFLLKWRSDGTSSAVASLLGLAVLVVLWLGAGDEDALVLPALTWLVLPPALGWSLATGLGLLEEAARETRDQRGRG